VVDANGYIYSKAKATVQNICLGLYLIQGSFFWLGGKGEGKKGKGKNISAFTLFPLTFSP
jgi:hypothetical protein